MPFIAELGSAYSFNTNLNYGTENLHRTVLGSARMTDIYRRPAFYLKTHEPWDEPRGDRIPKCYPIIHHSRVCFHANIKALQIFFPRVPLILHCCFVFPPGRPLTFCGCFPSWKKIWYKFTLATPDFKYVKRGWQTLAKCLNVHSENWEVHTVLSAEQYSADIKGPNLCCWVVLAAVNAAIGVGWTSCTQNLISKRTHTKSHGKPITQRQDVCVYCLCIWVWKKLNEPHLHTVYTCFVM